MIAWSYSRLSSYERCPKMFHHHNILKDVPFIENEAMKNGRNMHTILENQVQHEINNTATYNPQIDHVKPLITNFVRMHDKKVKTELQLAFTRDLEVCSWFSKTAWFRSIFDAIGIKGKKASIIDWKTGQVRKDVDQLDLFTLAAFLKWPQVEEVSTALVFIDHKVVTPARVTTRDQYPHLLRQFEDRSEMIQISAEKNEWVASPGSWCNWQCLLNNQKCSNSPRR